MSLWANQHPAGRRHRQEERLHPQLARRWV